MYLHEQFKNKTPKSIPLYPPALIPNNCSPGVSPGDLCLLLASNYTSRRGFLSALAEQKSFVSPSIPSHLSCTLALSIFVLEDVSLFPLWILDPGRRVQICGLLVLRFVRNCT